MVKKFRVLCFLIIAVVGTNLAAQAQRFVLKINPLSLFVVTANVQGEYAFNDKMSAQLGLYYGGVSLGFGADAAGERIKYSWMGVTPEFRYYVTNARHAAPKGFYIGPFLRYRNVTMSYSGYVYDPDTNTDVEADVAIKLNSFGGGAILGYQFLFGDAVALDLFFGPQYSSSTATATAECVGCNGNEDIDEEAGIRFGGVGIRTGISIGVAF